MSVFLSPIHRRDVEVAEITQSRSALRMLVTRSRVCRTQQRANVRRLAELMNKRPLSVTVIGYIFVAVGIIGFAYHVTEFKTERSWKYGVAWILLLRLLAILGGVFVLRGNNWARWLLLLWIACHVIISAFHSLSQFVVHALLLAVIAYVLFRPRSSAYFRSVGQRPYQ